MEVKINKISIFFLILILSVSCKQDKIKNLQNDIEDKIKTGLNDPSSYEFDYFYIDSLDYMIRKNMLSENLNEIDSLEKQIDNKNSTNKIKTLKNQNEILKSTDRFKYKGSFKFRGNNTFGAKTLVNYKFEADSTFTLMYLMDNNGDTIYKDSKIIMKNINKLMEEN